MTFGQETRRVLSDGRVVGRTSQHRDRDAQFHYLAAQVSAPLDTGQPVVSVDTKKNELVGRYQNGGRRVAAKGRPGEVNVHDFIGEEGRRSPTACTTWPPTPAGSAVGKDHDTAA